MITVFTAAFTLSAGHREGCLSLHFNGHFPDEPEFDGTIVHFIGAKGDGGGANNWSYKTCKAPVNKPTPRFSTGWMPFLSPSQQC